MTVSSSTPESTPATGTVTGTVTGTARVKRGMAEMLKGGVIMDVVNVEQARIAEDAGAMAVMALERVPADFPSSVAPPILVRRCAASTRARP